LRRLGFIGLGNIGRPIARSLIAPDAQVTVFDLAAEGPEALRALGAKAAASPAEVARAADVIGVCVRDDADVRAVLEGPDGVFSAARENLLVAIHSTIRVKTIHELAAGAGRAGVRLVDAPVSRGAAMDGRSITFMVGGAKEDVDRLRPVVANIALRFVEAGPLGSGMALKLCNNILSYAATTLSDEAFRLAQAAGLDLSALLEVISVNGVGSPIVIASLRRLAGVPRPSAGKSDIAPPSDESRIELAEKDLDYALALARDLGLDLPASELTRREYRSAVRRGAST